MGTLLIGSCLGTIQCPILQTSLVVCQAFSLAGLWVVTFCGYLLSPGGYPGPFAGANSGNSLAVLGS